MRSVAQLGWSLRRLIQPGRSRKVAEGDAHHLLEAYKGHAYREARERARAARKLRWAEGDRHWSRVARVIARREGREIGVRTADRYGL